MSDPDAVDTLRLFFALWPAPAMRERLVQAARMLECGDGARAVHADDYHLTLAFVGEVPRRRLADLQQIGREQRGAPLTLRFDAYEYWPKPEVAVAATRQIPAPLERLWASLHARLAQAGFLLQPKRLRPHVTLARKVVQAPVLATMSPFEWPAHEFHLVRSTTGGEHSVYTVVDSWPLLDEC
jgi:2'-5' RNA ligase